LTEFVVKCWTRTLYYRPTGISLFSNQFRCYAFPLYLLWRQSFRKCRCL